MKTKDFIVLKRPALSTITGHPTVRFDDYERRLQSMQSVMQSIQQAYLGTRERAVIVLEGWDTAGAIFWFNADDQTTRTNPFR